MKPALSSKPTSTIQSPAAVIASHVPAVLSGPGWPTVYGEHVVRAVCGIICERGISDNAAAVRAGLSTSSFSRWKKEHPELRIALGQAREDFRARHLDRILAATEQEGSGGWRASA